MHSGYTELIVCDGISAVHCGCSEASAKSGSAMPVGKRQAGAAELVEVDDVEVVSSCVVVVSLVTVR